MNWLGFIPSGIMIIFLGWSLILTLPKKFPARLGSALITIFGIGLSTVGFFSCDKGCPREGSLENNIHDQISGPIFLCAILGIGILGFTFRHLAEWRKLWIYSVVSSILSIILLFALIISLDSYRFTGTWQRLLLLTLFLWFGIIGVYTFKLMDKTCR
jgi:hypothetical protein